MRIQSYGHIVTDGQLPKYAGRRDGLFVAETDRASAVGTVVAIFPCEDEELRSIYATWEVELFDDDAPVRPTLANSSEMVAATEVEISLPVQATCGLRVTKV